MPSVTHVIPIQTNVRSQRYRWKPPELGGFFYAHRKRAQVRVTAKSRCQFIYNNCTV